MKQFQNEFNSAHRRRSFCKRWYFPTVPFSEELLPALASFQRWWRRERDDPHRTLTSALTNCSDMPACPSEQCQNETSTCSAVPRSWAEDSRSFGSPPPPRTGDRTHTLFFRFFLLPPPSKKWPSGQQKDIRNIRLGGKLNFSKRLIFYGRRFLTGRPWPRSTSGGKSPHLKLRGNTVRQRLSPYRLFPEIASVLEIFLGKICPHRSFIRLQ